MNRRFFLLTLTLSSRGEGMIAKDMRILFLTGLAFWFVGAGVALAEKPNIVFILADDLGYGDVGAYNADSKIATPHLDRLAGEGMRFTDAHSGGSTCVPSRYGLLTGRYAVRAKLNWKSEPVIEAERETIASVLKKNGYVTAMVGKWHQGFEGGEDGEQFDFTKPLRGGPLDRGFGNFFGMHASLDIPPYFYIRGRTPTAPPTEEIGAGTSEGHEEGWNRIQGAFWREGLKGPDFVLDEVTPRFASEAVRVLETHAASGARLPLFMYLALPSPHTPWLPSEEYRGKSSVGMYGDFVMQVDGVVGRVMEALKETGLAEDTLVIFSSDNGPVWYGENVERFGHDATGIMRGMKADGWEGGHRVPFIVRWPGRVKAGAVSDRLVCFTDVMATFAEVAGTKLPKDAGPDSISFYDTLVGSEEAGEGRRQLVHDRQVIRDGKWKLLRYLGSGGFTPPKKEEPEKGSAVVGQLYDMASDPGETTNVYGEHPEVVARLSAALDAVKPASEEGRGKKR
jgi:arylsulfatase A